MKVRKKKIASPRAVRLTRASLRTDAEILAAAAADPDSFVPSDADFKRAILVLPKGKYPLWQRLKVAAANRRRRSA